MNNKQDALYKTVSLRPYKMLCTSIHVRMYFVLAVLLIQLGMLFLTKSWASLTIILATVLAVELAEASEYFVRKQHIFNWLQGLKAGLIIGFLLPSTYPPITAFIITLCIICVCKWLLGGDTNVWVNPPALTIAVCWLIGMRLFPQNVLSVDILQTKNAALTLIQNGTIPTLPYDSAITAFLNKNVYRLFGVTVPSGYISLLWDSQAIIPAFRFNLLTILSSLVLIAFDVISPIIPMLYLFVYAGLVRFVAPLLYDGIIGQGDMILALFTSGTMFTTFFLLQWVGTIPLSTTGKACYGIVAGIFAFFIVGCGISSAGSIFTILVLNVISPIIQAFEAVHEDSYIQNVLIPKSEALQKEGVHA